MSKGSVLLIATLAIAASVQIANCRNLHSSSDASDTSSVSETEKHEGDFDGEKRPHCLGLGTRYCEKVWKASCPSPCKKACDGTSSEEVPSTKETFKGMRSDLKTALTKMLFDQAFIRDETICVANCKKGKGKCLKWTKYENSKRCMGIKCDNGIDGCHQTYDFTKINCGVCKIVFPSC